MDENNTQQPGGFPDTTGYVNPQQPDTTGYMNPPQSDMTGYANPQQPDMTGYYGQQPGQPDMTGYYGQQPGQPDLYDDLALCKAHIAAQQDPPYLRRGKRNASREDVPNQKCE